MKKTLQLRLAESINLLEQLQGIGIDRNSDFLRGFKQDLNAFVKEGAQMSGSINLDDGRTLHYHLKVRGNSVIFSGS